MWIVLAVVVVGVLYVIVSYNGLVTLRQRVKNSWAQVDVQLKRRYDLIPNLVNTVKGYASHEQDTFTAITEARSRAVAAGTTADQAQAENALTSSLRSLFAVAENYPELKADSNFRELQKELSETENKIAYARQFFNDIVQRFNTKVQMFPSNVIASLFGFEEEQFFTLELQAEERKSVVVDFNTEDKK